MNQEIDKIVKKALDRAFEYFRSGDYPNAEEIYRQILRVQPDLTAYQMLILATAYNGNIDDACKFANEGLEKYPDDVNIWNNFGLVLGDAGYHLEAIKCFEEAVSLKPEIVLHHTNLAIEYKKYDLLDQAELTFQHVVDKHPDNVHAWFNYAAFVQETGNLTKAISLYQRALEVDPTLAVAHYNLSACWFLLGEWDKAWPEYEWRWKYFTHFAATRNRFKQPYWDGSCCDKLLLYTEQGVGDALMFSRYIELAKERAKEVILEVPADLVELMRHLDIKVIKTNEPCEMDFHCSLLSLPLIFDTNQDNVPLPTKFKSSEQRSEEFWKNFVGMKKVGIAWAGSVIHPNDLNRSIPLHMFRGLYDVPDVKLFSLHNQHFRRRNGFDLNLGSEGMKVVDLGKHLTDWNKTASLVEQLDLVISVDTAVAHLAASMGKPTWLLLPQMPDWRWGVEGTETPWYPSMRLFRQKHKGKWGDVFQNLAFSLQAI